MDAAAIGSETLARHPSGPVVHSLAAVRDPGETYGRSRSLALRIVRLLVVTTLLIGLIGQGAATLRRHLVPHRSHTVVALHHAAPETSRA